MSTDQLDVEQQTELMYRDDTIWTAIFRADESMIEKLIENNPKVINEHGAVGECPIHLLFLCGTDEHLNIARDLIERFPSIATQIYNEPVSKIEKKQFKTSNDTYVEILWRKYSSYCNCETKSGDGRMVIE